MSKSSFSPRAIRFWRQTLQHKVAHLRAFLRFCADRGETARGLDRIDTPRTYRGELPPRAFGWDLFEKLRASVNRSDDLGRRDYTILHLMAYYGLRASDIAGLTLDAVNWKTGTMRIDQRKTRSTLVLPLSDQTLHILDQYLANRRPCTQVTTFLFPRACSPIGAMTNWAVCDLFTKRARGKRTAARRCLLLCTTPLVRHAIIGPGRWRENDRRPAWPS